MNNTLPFWNTQQLKVVSVVVQILYFAFCVWVVFDPDRVLRKFSFSEEHLAKYSGRPLKFLRAVALFAAWNLTAALYGWLECALRH